MPYGEPYAPPPYGGMPMSPYQSYPPPMPPGGPGFGPPPGPMMMPPPPPGLGDPVGFLIPGIFDPIGKLVGGLFGGGRKPPPPPAATSSLPPLPELFYSNRPEFCRVFCPPMPGMMPGAMPAGGYHKRRRHHRIHGLGDPVGALPLLAALAPLAMQILPGLISGLTKGGGFSGYGYYGEPPEGYSGW